MVIRRNTVWQAAVEKSPLRFWSKKVPKAALANAAGKPFSIHITAKDTVSNSVYQTAGVFLHYWIVLHQSNENCAKQYMHWIPFRKQLLLPLYKQLPCNNNDRRMFNTRQISMQEIIARSSSIGPRLGAWWPIDVQQWSVLIKLHFITQVALWSLEG